MGFIKTILLALVVFGLVLTGTAFFYEDLLVQNSNVTAGNLTNMSPYTRVNETIKDVQSSLTSSTNITGVPLIDQSSTVLIGAWKILSGTAGLLVAVPNILLETINMVNTELGIPQYVTDFLMLLVVILVLFEIFSVVTRREW